MDAKKEFIALLQSTERDGMDYVIEELEKSDFFKAPASSNFHLNCEGGLVEHSRCTMCARRIYIKLW